MRRLSWKLPNQKVLSRASGPPRPPLTWCCVYSPLKVEVPDSSPLANSRLGSRSAYDMEPERSLVPPREVLATWPPVNWPRAMSYVLVITRVLRTASVGTVPPNDRPSSVTRFWSARCPATEKPAAEVSEPDNPTTPGISAATEFGSEASIGRRASCSPESARSELPGVGWFSLERGVCRALTTTAPMLTAVGDRRKSATRRSSSERRLRFSVAWPKPMARTRS